MTNKPFLIAICGCKNSGKTTLITKLIPEFCKKGYKVATIKHDGHDFKVDVAGTDTYKHKQAGAYGTAIFSDSKFMIIKEEEKVDESYFINIFPEADVIFLEGFKGSNYPKLEIVRKENSSVPICNEKNLISIVSDLEVLDVESDLIDLNNTKLITEKILDYISKFK